MTCTVFGQYETLEDSLILAQELYSRGEFSESLELSKKCLKSENSTLKWQFYRIQSICLLAIADDQKARSAAESMLHLNPTYRSNRFRDPAVFSKLLSEITVIPKFSIGFSLAAGPNVAIMNVPKSIVLGEYTKNYRALNGFHAGAQLGLQLNPRWALNSGLHVMTKNYQIEYAPVGWDIKVRSRLTYLGIPLSLQYFINPTNRLRYLVEAGPYPQYLIYANSDFSSISNQPDSDAQLSLTNANVLSQRNRLNFGLSGGIGAYYKFNTGHLSAQVNYIHSANLINKGSTRFDNVQQQFDYQYADDDIRMNSMVITLGYSVFLNYQVYKKEEVKE